MTDFDFNNRKAEALNEILEAARALNNNGVAHSLELLNKSIKFVKVIMENQKNV